MSPAREPNGDQPLVWNVPSIPPQRLAPGVEIRSLTTHNEGVDMLCVTIRPDTSFRTATTIGPVSARQRATAYVISGQADITVGSKRAIALPNMVFDVPPGVVQNYTTGRTTGIVLLFVYAAEPPSHA